MTASRADPLAAAERLRKQAVSEQNLGHPTVALRLLSKARDLVEAADVTDPRTHSVLAAVWISIALNEAELHGADAGLRALEHARNLAEVAAEPRLVVSMHNQSGLISIRSGRFETAKHHFDEALLAIEHADENDHFVVLLNSGTIRMVSGELNAARPLLKSAVNFARIRHRSADELKSLHNLGYLDFLRGDIPNALGTMREAAQIGAGVSRGIPLLDRARVLIESGLIREADQSLVEAEVIFRRERLTQDLGETELERARCALLVGDVAAARRLAGRARDRFRRRGSGPWRRMAELALLQGDLADGRPGNRLVGPASRVRAEFEDAGLRLHALAAALIQADAHLAAGDLDAARGVLASVRRPDKRDPITTRLHYVHVRAKVDHALGRHAIAVRRVRGGLRDLADYQASFGSIDLSTAAAIHGRQLADLDISIALDRGADATAMFLAAEHARAVAHRLPAVRPPAHPEAADLLSELRQTVEALRASERDPSASAPLQRRRAELEHDISQLGWARSGSRTALAAASIDEVQAALRRDRVRMLMLIQSGLGLYALELDGGLAALRSIGAAAPAVETVRRMRADLDVLAQPRLPAQLRSAVYNSFARSATGLDEMIFGALGADDRPVVVVSTGVFGQAPWGLLPSLARVPVVVAPSATSWLSARRRARGRRDVVVALAGPDLDRVDQEVKAVAQAWDANTYLGGAADRGALTDAMSRARIVHIAAHGVHQTENPLFSSLRLAGGELFAHELDTTKRTPEHVVLSACELGLATVRPGDEALGLTSVLLHLGTRSVVAGVARVGDEVAAQTMTNYHRALAGGADSATALAGALAANDPDHPAPFVCFGAAWSAT